MLKPKTVWLEDAEWLEKSPTYLHLLSGDEVLAALVGYSTGDGSISDTTGRLQSAFYAQPREDLEEIAQSLHSIGMGLGASVCVKKAKSGYKDNHQIQLGRFDTNELIQAGAPLGKKTTIEFEVPKWIMTGSNKIKRAYISALFGAEGNTPCSNNGTRAWMPKQPVMSMCKIKPTCGMTFFEQLKEILESLGVVANVTSSESERFGKTYTTYWLRVAPNPGNLVRFFEDVGYTFCEEKSLKAWQWSQYIRSYMAEADRRRESVLSARKKGLNWEDVGKTIGVTRGAAYRLHSDIESGCQTTAGHAFPHFKEWLDERWISEKRVLKVKVVSKTSKPVTEVWNMLVSSPDHSYLLANGLNNFNSFETMSNRVYHAFDRNKHVKRVKYDPRLPIRVGMDFNIQPMSAVLFQIHGDGRDAKIKVFDEIYLNNSNTFEMSEELERRYWRQRKQIIIYPDPAGGSKSTTSRGDSDFSILRQKGFKRLKYRRKHPRIRDRVNSVNRMLTAADGTIGTEIDHSCKELIKSLEQTQYKKDTSDIDKKASMEHMTDALGYGVEIEFPVRELRVLGISI